MKCDKKLFYNIVLTFTVCLCIQANWASGTDLVKKLVTTCQPFVMGAGIAFVVNIVMTAYEKAVDKWVSYKPLLKAKRGLSLLLAYLTFIALVFMIFAIVLPDLIASLQSLLVIKPEAIQSLLTDIQRHEVVVNLLERFGTELDVGQMIANYSKQVLGQVLGTLTGVVSSVSAIASTMMNLFVSVIFSIYVLSSKETLARQANLLLETFCSPQAKRIRYALGLLNQRFRDFFVSQTLEALILGSLTALGMLLLGLPYVTTIGILISFTALIPIVGGMIGTAVGMLLILTQSWQQAVIFLIFTIVLQQLEGNLIYPRVVGGSIGLPGMWVLFAITLGGALGGILGMLLAVPLAATLYQILKDYTYHKRSAKL